MTDVVVTDTLLLVEVPPPAAPKAESSLESKLCFGYAREQLEAAFKKVQNPKNWKLAVSGIIDEKDVALTSAAIAFFTGSAMDVTQKFKNGRVRIWAAGYYACIGS